jgi:hypothetical protein
MTNFLMILFAVQIVVALAAVVFEKGKDGRFDADKFEFRS